MTFFNCWAMLRGLPHGGIKNLQKERIEIFHNLSSTQSFTPLLFLEDKLVTSVNHMYPEIL